MNKTFQEEAREVNRAFVDLYNVIRSAAVNDARRICLAFSKLRSRLDN